MPRHCHALLRARRCPWRKASEPGLLNKNFAVMRLQRCWALVCLALVGLLVAQNVRASLFAIDLGGENLKVAVVKPGRTPISIVINEMSRRKTPVLSGFIAGDRVMGEEAVTMLNRHPDKIFRRLRDMLGKRANDPAVLQLLQDDNLSYTIVEDPVRQSIRLKLPDTGKDYSVEELMVRKLLLHEHESRFVPAVGAVSGQVSGSWQP